jgi:hypothetical protein
MSNIMRLCKSCNILKEDDDFYENSKIVRCKSCQRKACRKNGWDDKLKVLSHYSNNRVLCDCCGEDHIEFLVIDHINGGGNIERKKLKLTSGRRFYRYLIKNNYPPGYRVLCQNCNMSYAAFGFCPHNKK